MQVPITVEVVVEAPLEKVWQYWTEPAHITQWNFASNDWACPSATNDVRVGGRFNWRMEARDGSAGFDFEGTYTAIEEGRRIAYQMADGRKVAILFAEEAAGIRVSETFDPETEHSLELQQSGWQAILANFKKTVEAS